MTARYDGRVTVANETGHRLPACCAAPAVVDAGGPPDVDVDGSGSVARAATAARRTGRSRRRRLDDLGVGTREHIVLEGQQSLAFLRVCERTDSAHVYN